ncbi:MAG: hypothetical protein IH878_00580, partial [Gemmatimonadetes bacterium]|nr:hypothetical protein [Gemmatimonadota bacterium]
EVGQLLDFLATSERGVMV